MLTRAVFCLLSLFTAAPLLAETLPPITTLVGTAYDLETGELLYTENHVFEYDEKGQLIGDEVRYLYPDGSKLGHKTLDFRPSPFLPNFLTVLDNSGYQEGLKRDGDKLVLLRREAGESETREKRIDGDDCDAGDAGFHPYVQANLDKLMSGDKVKFRFCAPGELTSVKFKARRVDDGEVEGIKTVRIRVEIASLLSLFVDPLQLSYDPVTKDLVQYEGLSNVRDSTGKAYETRIRYPVRRKAEAPEEAAPPAG